MTINQKREHSQVLRALAWRPATEGMRDECQELPSTEKVLVREAERQRDLFAKLRAGG